MLRLAGAAGVLIVLGAGCAGLLDTSPTTRTIRGPCAYVDETRPSEFQVVADLIAGSEAEAPVLVHAYGLKVAYDAERCIAKDQKGPPVVTWRAERWQPVGEDLRDFGMEVVPADEAAAAALRGIAPYDVVRLRGVRVQPPYFVVREVLPADGPAPALVAMAQLAADPPTVDLPSVGPVTYDPEFHEFRSAVPWADETVELVLPLGADGAPDARAVAHVQALWSDGGAFDTRARAALAAELGGPLSHWLPLGLSAETLARRIAVETVEVTAEGHVEMWFYDDAEALTGHSLVVTGPLAGGVLEVSLEG